MSRNFRQLLEARWDKDRFLCVGLDSDVKKLPKGNYYVQMKDDNVEDFGGQLAFNAAIVDATNDLVCAYKPNAAFYYAQGLKGMQALYYTIRYIRRVAPDVPVILDYKAADIGNTNNGYVEMAFDWLDADAVTVNPYFGAEAMVPFLDLANKGIIVLCRTSNKGGGEFQNLVVTPSWEDEKKWDLPSGHQGETEPTNMPLYKYMAYRVSREWNYNGNCGLVAGATYPGELAEIRKIVGDGFPLLIPGIDTQGGDVKETVKAGQDSKGQGMIVSSSRGIIFASKGEDFAEVARAKTLELHTLINSYR